MSKAFVYGLYYLQIAFRDSSGYMKGVQTIPNTVANNTTSHAYLLPDPVDFTHPAPTFELATDRGGQKIRAQADLGASDLGEGSFTLSEFDDIFHAYVRGVTVDTATVSGWRQVAASINTVTAPNFFLMATTKTQIVSSTGSSTTRYKSWVYPNVQIRPAYPNLSQNGGVNPNPVAYTFVPSTGSRAMDGRLFSATAMAATDNMDTFYIIESDSPLAATMYTKDAAATTFVLGYRPTTSDATGAATNSITNNGSTLVVTSVSTTTGVVTLAAAGTAAHIVNVLYETNFVAI
jgi:hypothetical protein